MFYTGPYCNLLYIYTLRLVAAGAPLRKLRNFASSLFIMLYLFIKLVYDCLVIVDRCLTVTVHTMYLVIGLKCEKGNFSRLK
jgi:hypothetical protein